MKEKIGQGFTQCDLKPKDQTNLTLKKTNEKVAFER